MNTGLLITIISGIIDCVKSISDLFGWIKRWWTLSIPSRRVMQQTLDKKTPIRIFVRDFFIKPGTLLFSQEGLNGPIGYVPHVYDLWPRVEGIALSKILNLLGQLNKNENIFITEMGKDPGIWNENLLIIGAQTQKCFDFYNNMENVAYKITNKDIIRKSNGKAIKRDPRYGYGIILKCKNPYVQGNKGIGFLVGGFGTLGTEASAYYFSQHIAEVGKLFKKKQFGIVVRALISAGPESVERLKKYDVIF